MRKLHETARQIVEEEGFADPRASVSIMAVALSVFAAIAGCGDKELTREPAESVTSRPTERAGGELGRGEEPGRTDFESYCCACHGSDGLGSLAGPPLASSPWVVDSPSCLIRIIMHGVRGPIGAGGGVTDNREMPGFGSILSDDRIADLVTFVRRQFGGPTDAITSEIVANVRRDTRDRSSYWTVEELLAEPP